MHRNCRLTKICVLWKYNYLVHSKSHYTYIWNCMKLLTYMLKLYTVGQKKTGHPYYLEYKVSYRFEICTNQQGLLSTSNGCFKIHLGVHLHSFNFFNENPQTWKWNRKVHRSNYLYTNFRNISDSCLRFIRSRNYNYCEFLIRKVFLLNIKGVDEESKNFFHTNII